MKLTEQIMDTANTVYEQMLWKAKDLTYDICAYNRSVEYNPVKDEIVICVYSAPDDERPTEGNTVRSTKPGIPIKQFVGGGMYMFSVDYIRIWHEVRLATAQRTNAIAKKLNIQLINHYYSKRNKTVALYGVDRVQNNCEFSAEIPIADFIGDCGAWIKWAKLRAPHSSCMLEDYNRYCHKINRDLYKACKTKRTIQ